MTGTNVEEEDDTSKSPDQPKTYFKGRKRSPLTLLALIFGNLLAASIVSLQAPFFPSEAEKKGATATQYGFVFGIYQLVFFLFAPIAGKLVSILPPRFILCSGIFSLGFCCVLFGALKYAPSGGPFLGLAFAIRIVEGVGSAAYTTTCFTIVAAEFPDRIGTTFALVGAFFGVGLIIGPTIGGGLYEAGGFTLPFIVIGCIMVVYTFIVIPLLPPLEPGKKSERIGLRDTFRFWYHFSSLVPAGCILVNFMIIGFNSALLEPHIRQFELTPFLVGTMFVISGGTYGITAPLWGYITDRWISPKLMCLLGTVSSTVCMLFLGPAPFFPFETQLWLVIVSLVFFGLGSGSQFVCAFAALKKDTKIRGYPENMTTNGLVSSVFATSQSLGYFIGPSLGGFLFDKIGFRKGSMFFLAMELIMVCVTTGYVIQERRSLKKNAILEVSEEKTSLLEPSKEIA